MCRIIFRLFVLLSVLTTLNIWSYAIPVSNSGLYKDTGKFHFSISDNIHHLCLLFFILDPITQMSITDFKSTVTGTSNSWLIEFYSSWCGHCIDFAPAFIQLAYDVKGKLLISRSQGLAK